MFLFEFFPFLLLLFPSGRTSGIDSPRDFLTFHVLGGQSVSCAFWRVLSSTPTPAHKRPLTLGHSPTGVSPATQSEWALLPVFDFAFWIRDVLSK